jgi:hypothetical protein
MWGAEHDGTSGGLEHEILVFEDAKVRRRDVLLRKPAKTERDAAAAGRASCQGGRHEGHLGELS